MMVTITIEAEVTEIGFDEQRVDLHSMPAIKRVFTVEQHLAIQQYLEDAALRIYDLRRIEQ